MLNKKIISILMVIVFTLFICSCTNNKSDVIENGSEVSSQKNEVIGDNNIVNVSKNELIVGEEMRYGALSYLLKAPNNENIEFASSTDVSMEILNIINDNEIIAKVMNNSNKTAFINNIQLLVKDKKADYFEEPFYILPNSEAYVRFTIYDCKDATINDCVYSINCFENAEEKTWKQDFEDSIINSLNVKDYRNNDTIILEVKNNSEYIIDKIKYSVVFYKDNKAIDIGGSSITVPYDVFPGEYAYNEVEIPDELIKKGFDEYKYSILNAKVQSVMIKKAYEALGGVEPLSYKIMPNKDLLVSLKNNTDKAMSVSTIYVIAFDNMKRPTKQIMANVVPHYIAPGEVSYAIVKNSLWYHDEDIIPNDSSSFKVFIDANEFNSLATSLDMIPYTSSLENDKLKTTFTNNSDVQIDEYRFICLFYKDGEIISCSDASGVFQKIEPGAEFSAKFSLPIDENGNNIEYESYDIIQLFAGHTGL